MLTFAVLCFLFVLVSTAAGKPRPQTRSVEVRIAWLTERVAHHQYVCLHGRRRAQAFSCAALKWTRRELREALAEKHRRDWSEPPEPYLSIGRCEQHSRTQPWGIQWDAFSRSYEGAYGFLHSTWRENRSPWMAVTANLAPPRQQLIVAKRLHAKYGWSPWPACHIKLNLNQRYP